MNYTSTSDMSAMVDAYLRCGLWATPIFDSNGDDVENPFNSEHNPPLTDIFELESIVEAVMDCRDFCEYVDNAENDPTHGRPESEWTAARDALNDMDPAQAGHDFFLTREHHGAGYWDRGLGIAGDRLSDAAHTFGPSGLDITYHGDDVYRAHF